MVAGTTLLQACGGSDDGPEPGGELLANKPLLTAVLTYHVLPARVLKAEVPVGAAVKTVQGDTLKVNASLQITDQKGRSSQIMTTDVFTSNGVIHAIDKVLLPA